MKRHPTERDGCYDCYGPVERSGDKYCASCNDGLLALQKAFCPQALSKGFDESSGEE